MMYIFSNEKSLLDLLYMASPCSVWTIISLGWKCPSSTHTHAMSYSTWHPEAMDGFSYQCEPDPHFLSVMFLKVAVIYNFFYLFSFYSFTCPYLSSSLTW